MSTKIYDAYKFIGAGVKEPTVYDVYKFLHPIKLEIIKFYRGESSKEEIIAAHKDYYQTRIRHGKAGAEKTDFWQVYGGSGYTNVCESCMIFPHRTGTYLKFFLGVNFRTISNRMEKSKKLLDFHYQDQADRPDELTAKQWKARQKIWEELIGDKVFRECGFIYDFYTFDDFDKLMTSNAWKLADARNAEKDKVDV